ncbi:MAG: ABC transporter permease [Acidimicrobiia bacterium]|nr:ABC transporter permease [Acidimicrobiia bacterium]
MSASRDVYLVALREVRERTRSRAFIVSTAFTLLLVMGVLGAMAFFADRPPPAYAVGVVGPRPPGLDGALSLAATGSGALLSTESLPDRAAAEAALAEDRIDAALLPGGTILVERRSSPDLESLLTFALRQAGFVARLAEAGIDPGEVESLLLPASRVRVEAVGGGGDDGGAGLGVATAGVVVLFVVISSYGQWVLTGVLEEKANRVVELVVAAIPVRRLLAGKVAGIGLLGLIQLLLLIGVGLGAGVSFGLFALPRTAVATAVWAVLWFLLGYAFYAVIFAAAGSLVSRQEDAQAAAMPIALGAVAVYLAVFVVVIPWPESTGARVLSFLPPAAPIAFPARIALDAVAPWEPFVGVAVMVAAVYAVVRLAARVYAGALLSSGARLGWRQAWRSARHAAAG